MVLARSSRWSLPRPALPVVCVAGLLLLPTMPTLGGDRADALEAAVKVEDWPDEVARLVAEREKLRKQLQATEAKLRDALKRSEEEHRRKEDKRDRLDELELRAESETAHD